MGYVSFGFRVYLVDWDPLLKVWTYNVVDTGVDTLLALNLMRIGGERPASIPLTTEDRGWNLSNLVKLCICLTLANRQRPMEYSWKYAQNTAKKT